MSEAIKLLNLAAKICFENDGTASKVVEYDDAITALELQKKRMIEFFKKFNFDVFLSRILREEKDWNKIFDERVKEI